MSAAYFRQTFFASLHVDEISTYLQGKQQQHTFRDIQIALVELFLIYQPFVQQQSPSFFLVAYRPPSSSSYRRWWRRTVHTGVARFLGLKERPKKGLLARKNPSEMLTIDDAGGILTEAAAAPDDGDGSFRWWSFEMRLPVTGVCCTHGVGPSVKV